MDESVSRRSLLRVSAGTLGLFAGCASSDRNATESTPPETTATAGSPEPQTDGGALELRGEPIADGFDAPVAAVVPDPDRVLVVDKPGQVHLVEDGERVADPVLDVADRLASPLDFETGLLGLALHPEFASNGRLFVRYSGPAGPDTPSDYSHDFVLAEFAADPDALTVDPASERVLLRIPEPQPNHNAGDLAFGPDGYLYVPVGDGGAANDQGRGHASDWYDDVDGGNGQDVTTNRLGSILRLDVDGDPADADREYAIPSDNPLVDGDGPPEQFAWGFRNPWRLSFGPDGRLFVGDVGQGRYEEVDVVEAGGNYGWNVREGRHCFPPGDCPAETPDGRPLIDPVIEYPHQGGAVSGISVIGGYWYAGGKISALEGTYVFADWRANGSLFVATEAAEGLWPTRAVPVSGVGPQVLSFGRDAGGELLVCTTGPGGASGAVHRLAPA